MRHNFQQKATGRSGDFFCLECVDWVNVFALTEEGNLVVVQQFRFGTRQNTLEVPGGMLEPGEDPLTGGLRELTEETGYSGGRALLIGSCQPNPAIMNNRCHYVFVEPVKLTQVPNWDENEQMHILTLPLQTVFKQAGEGELVHSLTLAGLLFLRAHLQKRGNAPV